MIETHRSLQEAPHCDNAPKFKGTIVLDCCSGILEMCHRGGRRYGSYSPATPQNEGWTQHSCFSAPKSDTGRSLFFAACVRKKPFMIHILSFYSVSGCNMTSTIFMKGKKSCSESLKLTHNTGGQLPCLRTVMCLK